MIVVPTAFPAPFDRYEGVVRPEWIDSNGHMNLAYYVVLFDQAIDMLFAAIGFGDAYRAEAGHGPFAVETHTLYERELLAGEKVRVSSMIVGLDVKRLHVAQEMYHATDGARAAAQEVMFLHVNLGARRSAPFTPGLRACLDAAAAAHRAMPMPDWIGRSLRLTPRERRT